MVSEKKQKINMIESQVQCIHNAIGVDIENLFEQCLMDKTLKGVYYSYADALSRQDIDGYTLRTMHEDLIYEILENPTYQRDIQEAYNSIPKLRTAENFENTLEEMKRTSIIQNRSVRFYMQLSNEWKGMDNKEKIEHLIKRTGLNFGDDVRSRMRKDTTFTFFIECEGGISYIAPYDIKNNKSLGHMVPIEPFRGKSEWGCSYSDVKNIVDAISDSHDTYSQVCTTRYI